MSERKRILVTGSRDWWNQPCIAAAILKVWIDWGRPPLTLVHGDAEGADKLAGAVIAEQFVGDEGRFTVEVHPYLSQFGNAGGHIRNAEMVKAGADMMIAFIRNNSRGATHCLGLAEAAGIPCLVYREDS